MPPNVVAIGYLANLASESYPEVTYTRTALTQYPNHLDYMMLHSPGSTNLYLAIQVATAMQ